MFDIRRKSQLLGKVAMSSGLQGSLARFPSARGNATSISALSQPSPPHTTYHQLLARQYTNSGCTTSTQTQERYPIWPSSGSDRPQHSPRQHQTPAMPQYSSALCHSSTHSPNPWSPCTSSQPGHSRHTTISLQASISTAGLANATEIIGQTRSKYTVGSS